MDFIQQKYYIIQEHDSSYYTKDNHGNLVKLEW